MRSFRLHPAVGLADIRVVMHHQPPSVDSDVQSARWSPSAKVALGGVVAFTVCATIFAIVFAALADRFLHHLGGL